MLFVSYASQDRSTVDELVSALRRTGEQVWLDEELGGGDAWWQTILDRIRGCSVFVVALSNNSLRSKPCQAELAYARELRRPVLPVQIGPVDSVRVTPLAATQIVEYRGRHPDAETRVMAALRRLRERPVPLPAPLPAEPAVPFAYLMRLANDLSGAELGYRQQAELVLELRARLDEDCHDPTVRCDIVQLLCRLRDRPDVTVRTRADVDAVLAANDPSFTAATVGMPTAAFSGPHPVSTPAGAVPAAPARRRRLSARTALIGGAVTAAVVAAGAALTAVSDRAPSNPAAPMLVDDADVNAAMEASGMTTVQDDPHGFKPSGSIQASRPDCLGVIYPGMDSVYAGSGAKQAAWKVLEEPGGLQRAGVDGRHFVDQTVAVFASDAEAAAFVQHSQPQWQACTGQPVTIDYPDHSSYNWVVGELSGAAPRIEQGYTRADGGYGCRRVLSAVANTAVDVKACGTGVGNRAEVLADMIAALVTRAPAF